MANNYNYPKNNELIMRFSFFESEEDPRLCNCHFCVSGNTYPVKDELKRLGYLWDPYGKYWVVDLDAPTYLDTITAVKSLANEIYNTFSRSMTVIFDRVMSDEATYRYYNHLCAYDPNAVKGVEINIAH